MRKLICDYCDEPIGIYEPVVFVADGEARETSRAAERELTSEIGDAYHLTCHRLRLAEPQAT